MEVLANNSCPPPQPEFIDILQLAGRSISEPTLPIQSSQLDIIGLRLSEIDQALEAYFNSSSEADRQESQQTFLSALDFFSLRVPVQKALEEKKSKQEIQNLYRSTYRNAYLCFQESLPLADSGLKLLRAENKEAYQRLYETDIKKLKAKYLKLGLSEALIQEAIFQGFFERAKQLASSFAASWKSAHPKASFAELQDASELEFANIPFLSPSNTSRGSQEIQDQFEKHLFSEYVRLSEVRHPEEVSLLMEGYSIEEVHTEMKRRKDLEEAARQEALALLKSHFEKNGALADLDPEKSGQFSKAFEPWFEKYKDLFPPRLAQILQEVSQSRMERIIKGFREWLASDPRRQYEDFTKSSFAHLFKKADGKFDEERARNWFATQIFSPSIARIFAISSQKGYELRTDLDINSNAQEELRAAYSNLDQQRKAYPGLVDRASIMKRAKLIEKKAFTTQRFLNEYFLKPWKEIEASGILDFYPRQRVRESALSLQLKRISKDLGVEAQKQVLEAAQESLNLGITHFNQRAAEIEKKLLAEAQKRIVKTTQEYSDLSLSSDVYLQNFSSSFQSLKTSALILTRTTALEAQGLSLSALRKQESWAQNQDLRSIETLFYRLRSKRILESLTEKVSKGAQFWTRIEKNQRAREAGKWAPPLDWIRRVDPLETHPLPPPIMNASGFDEFKKSLQEYVQPEMRQLDSLRTEYSLKSLSPDAQKDFERILQTTQAEFWTHELASADGLSWRIVYDRLRLLGLNEIEAAEIMKAHLQSLILDPSLAHRKAQIVKSTEERFKEKEIQELVGLNQDQIRWRKLHDEISREVGLTSNAKALKTARYSIEESSKQSLENWLKNNPPPEDSWSDESRRIAGQFLFSVADSASLLRAGWNPEGYLKNRDRLVEWINDRYSTDGRAAVAEGIDTRHFTSETLWNNPVVTSGRIIGQTLEGVGVLTDQGSLALANGMEYLAYGSSTTTLEEMKELENAGGLTEFMARSGRYSKNTGLLAAGLAATLATGGATSSSLASVELTGLSATGRMLALRGLAAPLARTLIAKPMRAGLYLGASGALGQELFMVGSLDEEMKKELLRLDQGLKPQLIQIPEVGVWNSMANIIGSTYESTGSSQVFMAGSAQIAQKISSFKMARTLRTIEKLGASVSSVDRAELLLRGMNSAQKWGAASATYIDFAEGLSEFPDTIKNFDWSNPLSTKNLGTAVIMGSNGFDTFDMSWASESLQKLHAYQKQRVLERRASEAPRKFQRHEPFDEGGYEPDFEGFLQGAGAH